MLLDVERTLTALAALRMVDEQARQELAYVEVALERIREALYVAMDIKFAYNATSLLVVSGYELNEHHHFYTSSLRTYSMSARSNAGRQKLFSRR